MVLTIGIFADTPRACTGFAVVNDNIMQWLMRLYGNQIRLIYFARFEIEKGVSPQSSVYNSYEIVGCEGGVWKPEVVKDAIKKYKLNIIYSEDDWWSAKGLVQATQEMKKPFYFMTPIDSLPIQKEAYEVFKYCRKVFVPNQAYRYISNGVYLPHAVDWMTFHPVRNKAFDKFTFLWIGRDERRKALGRMIKAYEQIYKKYDCNLVIRTNWDYTPTSRDTGRYIMRNKLPVIRDMMANCPHGYLANIYSACNAYVCTSKAGACEMGILEAQACALPVLVTDWTFMNENVLHGKTGFLIPISGYDYPQPLDMRGQPDSIGRNFGVPKGRIWGRISVDELANKMVWMIENQKKAWKMGIKGLEWMRQYSWEDVADNLYKEIIEDFENFNKKQEK